MLHCVSRYSRFYMKIYLILLIIYIFSAILETFIYELLDSLQGSVSQISNLGPRFYFM